MFGWRGLRTIEEEEDMGREEGGGREGGLFVFLFFWASAVKREVKKGGARYSTRRRWRAYNRAGTSFKQKK